jgi:hypothetical protein
VLLTLGCLDRPVQPQDPRTSNIFIAEIRQTAVDKIDLLFMIDNSISMADKQAILAQAVPVLLSRLVTPACLDANEMPTGANADDQGRCSSGSPEFSPIKDIHIGIVTSSLGAHGGDTCRQPTEDDKGQLIGAPGIRPTPDPMFQTWANSGFLAWDPDPVRARNNPRGTQDAEELNTNFTNMLRNSGEIGCGYEASLEAWYRFLIDPEPPTRVDRTTDGLVGVEVPADRAQNPVLVQRDKFLRPDSLVAIVMLTDENDCSIIDEGQGWLVGLQQLNGGTFRMPRSTSACLSNPNSACCTSCQAVGPATGCPDPKADPECAKPAYTTAEDHLNLRCFNQRQRFGFDLLYGVQRYVDGLTEPLVRNRAGQPVANPLYTAQRDSTLIFLAGIIGVPWQDVSTEASWQGNANLEYLSYDAMEAAGRWNWILGSPGDQATPPGMPLDGLMYETPMDRTQVPGLPQMHPGTGQAIAGSGQMGLPNAINGHEANIADGTDLQYACIFPLAAERRDCTGPGCDCTAGTAAMNRPLCSAPTVQTHAKAYPGVRHLQVLQGFGKKTHNAIVASICPKKVQSNDPRSDPGYGYNPAVAAIVDRLKEALRGKCLPRKLIPDEANENKVPCSVVEAQAPMPGAQCGACDPVQGRSVANTEIIPAVKRNLEENGYCGTAPGQTSCDAFCLCEIQQFSGAELRRCQTDGSTPTDIFGYCYVDPSTASDADRAAQDTIVASCPDTQKRLLRFAGDNVPAKGAVALIACLGSTQTSATPAMP